MLIGGRFTFEGTDKESVINNIINQMRQQGTGMKLSENKAGLAGGDTDFTFGFGNTQHRITVQDKFSNEGNGWNGIGAQGISNGFNFYLNSMFDVVKYRSKNPGLSDQEINNYLDKEFYAGSSYSSIEEDISNQINSQIEQLWVETMTSNSNFAAWLE